ELARDRGITIFISTHFMNEAARCDRIALMYEGKILTTGKPSDIIEEAGAQTLEQAFIARLEKAVAPAPPERVVTELDPRRVQTHEAGFRLQRLWTYSRREWMEIRRD